MNEQIQHYTIAATHPCFAGHFPNNPVVPGVVVLDYVRQLLSQWQPTLRIKTLRQAKFLQPLYPEQVFSIHLQQLTEQMIKFECRRDEQQLVVGTLNMEKNQ